MYVSTSLFFVLYDVVCQLICVLIISMKFLWRKLSLIPNLQCACRCCFLLMSYGTLNMLFIYKCVGCFWFTLYLFCSEHWAEWAVLKLKAETIEDWPMNLWIPNHFCEICSKKLQTSFKNGWTVKCQMPNSRNGVPVPCSAILNFPRFALFVLAIEILVIFQFKYHQLHT